MSAHLLDQKYSIYHDAWRSYHLGNVGYAQEVGGLDPRISLEFYNLKIEDQATCGITGGIIEDVANSVIKDELEIDAHLIRYMMERIYVGFTLFTEAMKAQKSLGTVGLVQSDLLQKRKLMHQDSKRLSDQYRKLPFQAKEIDRRLAVVGLVWAMQRQSVPVVERKAITIDSCMILETAKKRKPYNYFRAFGLSASVTDNSGQAKPY